MLENTDCPACGENRWETRGKQVFAKSPAPSDPYTALRYRVLFDLWAPKAEEFSARFCLCQACGFLTYLPRPSSEDIARKYEFLSSQAAPPRSQLAPSALDRERSGQLLDFFLPFMVGSRTLDFGGGTGALLTRFADEGFDCNVVDYVKGTVPGVTRLGSTLKDIADGETFDNLIACHVFEHLADPFVVACELRKRLSPCGVLLVEVPLEIIGGLPRLREPVTHVNFFCESSLRSLLERARFEVLTCRTMPSRFESGALRFAVRAVVRTREEPGLFVLPGADEANKLLLEGSWGRWSRTLKNPVVWQESFKNKIPRFRHALSA